MIFGATNWIWRAFARRHFIRIARQVGCSVNNYDNHAMGKAPQLRSGDFWSAAGRGFAIPPAQAYEVMGLVRQSADRYPWKYMIYGAVGYLPDGTTFEPFGGDLWNAGHVHVSLRRRR